MLEQLNELLEVEFTFIHPEGAANAVAQLPQEEQRFLLDWVGRIASTNIQIAFQFLEQVASLIDVMDREVIEAWALDAVDTYDSSGLRAAIEVIEQGAAYVERHRERRVGALLEQNESVLLHFIQGLSGRRLKLKPGGVEAYTDSETLFLPNVTSRMVTAEQNYQLLKATAVYLWAQTRFGTFRQPLTEQLSGYDDLGHAIACFASLERLRLDSYIERELPGVARQMVALKTALGELELPPQWQGIRDLLSVADATVAESVALVEQCYALPPLQPVCYQGVIDAAEVATVAAARIEREKALLRIRLGEISREVEEGEEGEEGRDCSEKPKRFDIELPEDQVSHQLESFELTIDDHPVAPPEDVKALVSSIMLDLGEIPDEYLVAAGPGEYDPGFYREEEADPDAVWQGTYHEEGAFIYHEWDYKRQHYRKNWCAVREREVKPVEDEFVAETMARYSGMIKQLRKTFEAMRDEDRLLKRQVDGEDVDIDALVEALADAQDGSEMSDRLFTRMHRADRNIAVMLMVDMSGSTKGWINDAERESLLLLSEALESLGDRYAIYGFSGMSRKRCELFRIKRFDEPYNETVQARISGIEPQDYTRMGFAIRHLSQLLNEVDARTRILITLSDGKPDDYNDYRGEYGIEDTRRALIEARRSGIHPYCITIDEQARDYLPHLYGPASFTVVDDVRQLPLKVSDIYRRLTT
ncbi:nitric oxide reductase activation protein [Solemya pervernicosa gill symbiont]|uniref:Nitric oxide reductase activation protein n=1 Tax=Solemya pervernicosa gill symbiont TaxID=642797 RepID=A0A1T2LAD5_9GAMM|nr:nitric oxide reductase activation protein [Solemya pervernicosa gill symbiont]